MDDKGDGEGRTRTYRSRMVLPSYRPRTAEDFENYRARHSEEEIQVALDEHDLTDDAATAARVYLLRMANQRAAEREKESREHETRAVAAAEVSARSSSKSAYWTMVAAFAAALGTLATAIAAIVPFFMRK